MCPSTRISTKNSIATKLLKVVFSLYIVIAISVTMVHMSMEYRYQKDNISRDLENIQRTFEQVLAAELWHMDHENLESTVKGMLEIPVIVGVKIFNDRGDNIAVGGIIEQNADVGNVGLHVNILGLAQSDVMVHEEERYNLTLFKHQFPIIYTYEGEDKLLGEAEIYSSTSVILRRVKLGFILLIVSTIFKVAVLWFIFQWVFSFILRQPLSILTAATQKVDLDNLEDAKVDIKRTGNDELKLLEGSFNSMIMNLQMSLDKRKQDEEELIGKNQQLLASEQQLRANSLEREQLVKTLKFKNRELQDIVYSASHDLRSPLVNIGGFSSILTTDCDRLMELVTEQNAGQDKTKQIEALLKENIPESLDFITRSAEKMVSLLDGLLQVSRVGTVEINSESLDMDMVVSEVLVAMEHQVNESGVSITIEALPGCIGDASMLDHVLTNLIGNAVKYLDPARKGEIKISGEVKDGMSIYCVEDNGIGIAAGHQDKVFEIFHRLDPEGPVSGEGLGLTIVTRILDRMGGNIQLESEPGRGSKFFISLPTEASE